jgi:hypothetical protein
MAHHGSGPRPRPPCPHASGRAGPVVRRSGGAPSTGSGTPHNLPVAEQATRSARPCDSLPASEGTWLIEFMRLRVVGKTDHTGINSLERGNRLWRPAEEERLGLDEGGRRSSGRQAALEVADHQVERAGERTQVGGPQLGGASVPRSSASPTLRPSMTSPRRPMRSTQAVDKSSGREGRVACRRGRGAPWLRLCAAGVCRRSASQAAMSGGSPFG